MAGLPGSIPALLPAGEDELVRRMRDLERRMDEMGPSVARSFGPMLATVVRGGEAGDTEGGFGLAVTYAPVVTLSIAVPAGFTKAVVFAGAHAVALNNSAGLDYLLVTSRINGTYATNPMPSSVPVGVWGDAHATQSIVLTGLGSAITVEAMARSNYSPWAAEVLNRSSINSIVIFYR